MTIIDRIERMDPSAAAFVAPLLDDAEDVDVIEGDVDIDVLDRDFPVVIVGAVRAGTIVTGEHAHLIVLGDVTARSLVCTGGLYIHGSLRVDELVYLCSGNDYAACIAGDLTAPLVIEHGMHTTIGGTVTGQVITTHNRFVVGPERHCLPHTADAEADAILAHMIVPEAFATDENGNGGLHEGLLRLACEGARVLRPR